MNFRSIEHEVMLFIYCKCKATIEVFLYVGYVPIHKIYNCSLRDKVTSKSKRVMIFTNYIV